jgi:hypothetical protein
VQSLEQLEAWLSLASAQQRQIGVMHAQAFGELPLRQTEFAADGLDEGGRTFAPAG